MPRLSSKDSTSGSAGSNHFPMHFGISFLEDGEILGSWKVQAVIRDDFEDDRMRQVIHILEVEIVRWKLQSQWIKF